MPSECRMPSIFGPTPEISFRSSSVAGLSMPAGRLASVSDGFAATASPADRLAAQQFRRLDAGVAGLVIGACAACRPSRPPAPPCWRPPDRARRFDACRLLGRRVALTGDGVFSAALVSAASRLRLGGLRRRHRGRVFGAGLRLRAPWLRVAVDFSTAFSSVSDVSPVSGAERPRSFCGPGWHVGALAGIERVDDLASRSGVRSS